VIIGGWTPALLFPQSDDPHIGSLDIDIAPDFAKIPNDTYLTILKSFRKRGYEQDKDQPFRFYRTVAAEGLESVRVAVDLMAGEYGGTGKSHRTQVVQDARARKARGCDLAFESTITVTIEGELPGGGMDKVSVKVAGIVPFLVMKGMAMYERLKEKDAYDIFFCIEHYPGGVDALVQEFKPHLKNKLVRERLGKIRSKFATLKHVGPKWVADFLESADKDEREILMRRAYEKVLELLNALEISEWEGARL
jgi:predicted nucleotidyltransferase